MEFPTLTYERLQVGEEFVSDTFLVTPEEIETYAFAVDDHHPWFFGSSPFGGPVAHPTLLGNQALRLRHSQRGRNHLDAGMPVGEEIPLVEIEPGARDAVQQRRIQRIAGAPGADHPGGAPARGGGASWGAHRRD